MVKSLTKPQIPLSKPAWSRWTGRKSDGRTSGRRMKMGLHDFLPGGPGPLWEIASIPNLPWKWELVSRKDEAEKVARPKLCLSPVKQVSVSLGKYWTQMHGTPVMVTTTHLRTVQRFSFEFDFHSPPYSVATATECWGRAKYLPKSHGPAKVLSLFKSRPCLALER